MGASLGKAKLTLTDKAGKTLWTAEKPLTALESYVSAEIPGVKLWSAEEPNLYTLTVVLTNAQGQVTEVCRTKVGFRQFEMKDKIMCRMASASCSPASTATNLTATAGA